MLFKGVGHSYGRTNGYVNSVPKLMHGVEQGPSLFYVVHPKIAAHKHPGDTALHFRRKP